MTSDGRKPIKCGKCGAPIPNDGRLDHAAIAEGLGSELRCPNCVPAFVKAAMGALPGARAGDGYQAVPVDAARELAATYGKDVVVILAWDQRSNRTHLTTYGRTAEWKPAAARLGDICAKAAIGTCEPVTGTTYEDYRERTAASWAEERERLLQRIHVLETGIAQGLLHRAELSTEVGRLTRCLICLVDAVNVADDLAALKRSPEAREAREAVEQFSLWIQRARGRE